MIGIALKSADTLRKKILLDDEQEQHRRADVLEGIEELREAEDEEERVLADCAVCRGVRRRSGNDMCELGHWM